MKFKATKEQRGWGISAFLVLAATALFVMLLLNLSEAVAGVRWFLSLFIPFYIGFAIAYLLNPIMVFWEEKVFHKLKRPQLRRVLSLSVTYLLFILVLGGMLAYLLPQLFSSITSLVNDIPGYYKAFLKNTTAFIEAHPGINEIYTQYSTQINGIVERGVSALTGYLSGLLPKIANTTLQIGTGLMNFFIGMIIAIYFLHGKEKLIAQMKKVLNFIFKKEEQYRKVLNVGSVTHEKTLHFITARLVDSLIIAILAYVIMAVFEFPYALLNALIIGVFNTIPYFGSWIGAVPPALIILIVKPSYFLWYLIFIVLLQQLDGNIIGPKIQGRQLGLSALWIMFAIFLFGGIFGFFGMVIGVPLFAVIYYFVTAAINNGLLRQGKSAKTADYAPPEAREIIENEEEGKSQP